SGRFASLHRYRDRPDLPSFPTRRSSDLGTIVARNNPGHHARVERIRMVRDDCQLSALKEAKTEIAHRYEMRVAGTYQHHTLKLRQLRLRLHRLRDCRGYNAAKALRVGRSQSARSLLHLYSELHVRVDAAECLEGAGCGQGNGDGLAWFLGAGVEVEAWVVDPHVVGARIVVEDG